ncbi:major facilitator superfamily domain-containing protein 3 isoform X2 [Oncorhynchus kisutch]|uniref:Major facilitator superfamily domain-containing protein 3 n=1 Tax=Oncorhynchus kisutch TaxID=8019 RepID=A0A8C7HZ15_ONCKI|nr:major facilitator superfamily domain-containing protein 3 isoform X2 [Oncorhynchus kisutch]XP_031686164.1 major facilitator superfamily domain-containing protein 3 isoform X2 [Oncorhynchus kisutch]
MNDKLVFLGLLYFVQGIPYGLQSSLLPVYLRGAGHSLTRIGLTKILYFPWVLKVLWAPLVDRVGTKRLWLVATVSGLAFTCLSSATLSPEAHIWGVAGTLLAMNALASVQDIAVDGAAVGLLKGRSELGLGNTAQVVGYKAGSVFAGGGLLAVIDVVGWGPMFMLLAFVYFGVALFVWGAPVLDDELLRGQAEGRRGVQSDAVHPWRVWRKLLSVPGTPWTIIYVLTYKLGEQGAVTMFPLFLLDNHMTARELGFWNGVIAMGFSICGSSLGGLLLSQFSIGSLMRRVFVMRTVSMVFQSSLLTVLEPSPLMKGHPLQFLVHPGSTGEADVQCPGGGSGGLGGLSHRLPPLPGSLGRHSPPRLEGHGYRGPQGTAERTAQALPQQLNHPLCNCFSTPPSKPAMIHANTIPLTQWSPTPWSLRVILCACSF